MSPVRVEIDPGSGFCGGVIKAISTAEAFLDTCPRPDLYSLGDIVHNEQELARLGAKGLRSVSLSQLPGLASSGQGARVLIRAHGEPPSTYSTLSALDLDVTDCTCPVVLRLQRSIREAWQRLEPLGGTLIIFGKRGHAEVLGLQGQTDGHAVVVEDEEMLLEALEDGRIRPDAPVELFSQTTKSPDGYEAVAGALRSRCSSTITVHKTICSQMASRHAALSAFAAAHDVVVFVAGDASSNGKVLYNLCKSVNPRTYKVASGDHVEAGWFRGGDSVGVCGATSTPKWLLEDVARMIENLAI